MPSEKSIDLPFVGKCSQTGEVFFREEESVASPAPPAQAGVSTSDPERLTTTTTNKSHDDLNKSRDDGAASSFSFKSGRRSVNHSGSKRKSPNLSLPPSETTPPLAGATAKPKKSKTKPAREVPCCLCPSANQCSTRSCPCAKAGRACTRCGPGEFSRCCNGSRKHPVVGLTNSSRLDQPATASSFSKRIASLRNADGSLPTTLASTFSVGRSKAASGFDALFGTSFSQEETSSDPAPRPSSNNHVEDAEMDASAPIGEPALKPSATAVDGASASILDLQNTKPAASVGGVIGGGVMHPRGNRPPSTRIPSRYPARGTLALPCPGGNWTVA